MNIVQDSRKGLLGMGYQSHVLLQIHSALLCYGRGYLNVQVTIPVTLSELLSGRVPYLLRG